MIPAAFLAAFLLVSCAPSEDERQAEVSVDRDDSAAVPVATVRGDPAHLPTWELGATELRFSGEGEGDAPYFEDVSDAAWLSGGGVAVADGGARRVHFFGPEGGFRGSVGGEGQGPGEFDRISTLSVAPGDTVGVYDAWLHRLTLFHPEEGFERVISLGAEGAEVRATDAWYLGSGRYVRAVNDPEARSEEVAGADGVVKWTGEVAVTLEEEGVDGSLGGPARLRGASQAAVEDLGFVRAPFGEPPVVDAGPEGALLGEARWFRLEVRGLGFEPGLEIRWPGRGQALTDAHVAELQERTGWDDNHPHASIMFDDALLPDSVPVLGDALLDRDGRVWAGNYRAPGAPELVEAWVVFGDDGEPLGRLDLPEGVRLLDAEGDRVLVVVRDELDVPHVEVIRLETP